MVTWQDFWQLFGKVSIIFGQYLLWQYLGNIFFGNIWAIFSMVTFWSIFSMAIFWQHFLWCKVGQKLWLLGTRGCVCVRRQQTDKPSFCHNLHNLQHKIKRYEESFKIIKFLKHGISSHKVLFLIFDSYFGKYTEIYLVFAIMFSPSKYYIKLLFVIPWYCGANFSYLSFWNGFVKERSMMDSYWASSKDTIVNLSLKVKPFNLVFLSAIIWSFWKNQML